MNIFLDVETTTTDQDWARKDILAKMSPPGNYKKPEAIEKWWKTEGVAKEAEAIARTALDTSLARIICLGYAIGDGKVTTLTGPEDQILRAFYEDIKGFEYPNLVGHNIIAFDIPLIYHRAVINKVPHHRVFHMQYKPWSTDIYDTSVQWAGARDHISLDKLCKLLGIPGKGDIIGADVPGLYEAGEIDKIAEYCAEDVERVRAIYTRLTSS